MKAVISKLPVVVQLSGLLRDAEDLSRKLEELPALKEEISTIENQIRDAASDSEAMTLAGDLEDKRSRATVMELRRHHHELAAAEAWKKVVIQAREAAEVIRPIMENVHQRASNASQRILAALADPKVDHRIMGGDSHSAFLLQQHKANALVGMNDFVRVVWSLRTQFSIQSQTLPRQFAANLMEEFAEAERSLPEAEAEIQRLEAAAHAVENIFS